MPKNSIPRITVVGSINMDLVLTAERAPSPGENLIGRTYAYVPGGKGANQAVAAARLGGETCLAGKLGRDANGRALREYLGGQKISTDFLVMDAASQTGLAVIVVESTGENRILVYPGANLDLKKDEVDRALSAPCDAVMLQLEIPADVVVHTCCQARRKGVPVVLDAGPAQAFPLEELGGVEILSPNETETLALTGTRCDSRSGIERAAAALQKRAGARWVVIKLGRQGAFIYGDGRAELFAAYEVVAVDPTAAGDAFTAAMTVEYVRSGDIGRAIRYGNIAGALTVLKLGAQPSLPSGAEVEAFARERGIKW